MSDEIKANCGHRDMPGCSSCARAGNGDYSPLVHKNYDKKGNVTYCKCLSWRPRDAEQIRKQAGLEPE